MSNKTKIEDYEEIKVILLGDTGVGKTNLISTSIGNSFMDEKNPTISASYILKKFEIKGKKYALNLWDTAGQEKYLRVTKLFFKGSGIVILVYDITNSKSFESMKQWYQMSKDIINNEHIYAVVGNKNDLFLNAEVKEEDAKRFANSINSKFKMVSAKTQPNLFIELLEELIIEYKKLDIKNRRKSVKLKNDKRKINNCC